MSAAERLEDVDRWRSALMNGFTVAGFAWAVGSIFCGIAISAWIIAHEASFASFDGVAGAAMYLLWYSLMAALGALWASILWMLVIAWPVAALTYSARSLGRLRLLLPVVGSVCAGFALDQFDPRFWIWPGLYAAPAYGIAVAIFSERIGHA